MRKRNLAISLAAAGLAVAAGGGAYAATQSGSGPSGEQSLVADVAGRLHVTPTQLTDAVKAALIDQIDAAAKAGRLTQAEANQLKQRIQQAPGIPFGLGEHGFGPPGPGFGHPGPGPDRFLGAAATYLGVTQDRLRQQLQSGKSLAQVAAAQHKSVAGLEQAIKAAAKAQLDQAVMAGRITRAQEQQRLSGLGQLLPNLVNRTPPAGPPGALRGYRGYGPPAGAPISPGGPGGYGGYGGPANVPPPPGA